MHDSDLHDSDLVVRLLRNSRAITRPSHGWMREPVSDIVIHRRAKETADRLEKWSFTTDFVHSLGFNEALDSHQEHRERIQNKLKEFLSAQEARETAARAHRLALDIDEEIGRILKDPLVGRLYEYDGQLFTARGIRLFHTRI